MNRATHSEVSNGSVHLSAVGDGQNDHFDNADRTSHLEKTIEKLTLDINKIRDTLKSEGREHEQFESAILPRIEIKERELRHFLIPRSLHPEAGQNAVYGDVHTNVSATGAAIPIQSTVPAVRPVLSLIGGSSKTSSDGLLPNNCSLMPSGNRSPTKPGLLPATSTTTYSGQHPKQSFCGVDARTNRLISTGPECSSETDLYSKVPVDPSVLLVFSRLRRAQEHCSALVTTNQTDLQSFTFTHNSQNGKRIMMRVRVLEQENQELAILNRTGRAVKLETEITLKRHLLQDLKKAHVDMEHLVEEVENETEIFGSSLLVLQQRLNLARTMAQVLASALAADEPSGQLLKALVSSDISPHSIDWLIDSLGIQGSDEEVTGETEMHLSSTQKIDNTQACPTSDADFSIPTAEPLSPNRQKRVKQSRHLYERPVKQTKDKCHRSSLSTDLPGPMCKKLRLYDEDPNELLTNPRTLQNRERTSPQRSSAVDDCELEGSGSHLDDCIEQVATDCASVNCQETPENACGHLAVPQKFITPHIDKPIRHQNRRISVGLESSSNSELTSFLTNGAQSI